MNKFWVNVATSVIAAGLALALGLAGEQLAGALGMSATTLLLAGALLEFIVLAVSLRVNAPAARPGGDEIALVFPMHWGTLGPLGALAGLLLGLGTTRLIADTMVARTIHSYEVTGLIVGIVAVLLLAFARNPIPAAAFGLGYGLALASAILVVEPGNNLALTYGGHVGVMAVAAALVVVFGHFFTIKIVD